jgi:outer membrane protein TolC
MNWILFLILPYMALAREHSLPSLVEAALKHAPQLRSYAEQTNISEARLAQARLIANPIATIQTGSMRMGAEAAGASELTLAQPFPWPGRRETLINARKFRLDLSKVDKTEGHLLVAHQTILLATQYVLYTEIEKHHQERRNRFTLIQKFLATRPLASPKQQVEKNLIEAQIKFMESSMHNISSAKKQVFEELRVLTAIAGEDHISLKWDKLPALREQNYYLQAWEHGPGYLRLSLQRSLAQNQIEQARFEARPDIVAGVNYRNERIAPGTQFYHAQLSMVIPIIDYGQHSEQVARANFRRVEALDDLHKKNIQAQILQLYTQLEFLTNTIKLFPESYLKQLEHQFISADEAFRKGQIDVMTFLQTDTLMHEMVDKYYSSRADYLSRMSQLEVLLGRKLELI